jgi:hypothetical protein
MTAKERLLEAAHRLQRAHSEWMEIASRSRFVTDPECMEAFRRREAAQEEFDEAWNEALRTIH